jgi:RNA polymerase sigma-70 factor, ECF subfamily
MSDANSIGDPAVDTAAFEKERPRLHGIAYRMLGIAADADDIVQEAWLRFAATPASIDNPAAWLTTVVTRLAIDRLRSAQVRRETYVGPWLPEPLPSAATRPVNPENDPEGHALMAESLSIGFLSVLERLSPLERAALLLHDVFGFSMAETASVIERSESATRQLAKRAREHVQGRPRFSVDPSDVEALSDAFFAAAYAGDLQRLESMLHDDAVQINDGGPRFRASRRPVVGKARIARFMVSLVKKAPPNTVVHRVIANGQFAYYLTVDDKPMLLLVANWVDGKLAASYGVRNEDKLASFDRIWRATKATQTIN